ncbi:hypothetical protein, partial [Clostridium tarantellae]|uniref:hypothetical protein n=1 Tax=Clostridium tarantellae TaxID=39493 RepID=UPI0014783930
YYSLKDDTSKNQIITMTELIISERLMLILKQKKARFSLEPIYSNKTVNVKMFNLNEEIKQLLEKCK